ncbi:unnamed protein product [Amoebophrya sp. A120]|nr:unnamed protein product [Amoebophrya sp. A120]|eukprot:GSA120T00022071001.1
MLQDSLLALSSSPRVRGTPATASTGDTRALGQAAVQRTQSRGENYLDEDLRQKPTGGKQQLRLPPPFSLLLINGFENTREHILSLATRQRIELSAQESGVVARHRRLNDMDEEDVENEVMNSFINAYINAFSFSAASANSQICHRLIVEIKFPTFLRSPPSAHGNPADEVCLKLLMHQANFLGLYLQHSGQIDNDAPGRRAIREKAYRPMFDEYNRHAKQTGATLCKQAALLFLLTKRAWFESVAKQEILHYVQSERGRAVLTKLLADGVVSVSQQEKEDVANVLRQLVETVLDERVFSLAENDEEVPATHSMWMSLLKSAALQKAPTYEIVKALKLLQDESVQPPRSSSGVLGSADVMLAGSGSSFLGMVAPSSGNSHVDKEVRGPKILRRLVFTSHGGKNTETGESNQDTKQRAARHLVSDLGGEGDVLVFDSYELFSHTIERKMDPTAEGQKEKISVSPPENLFQTQKLQLNPDTHGNPVSLYDVPAWTGVSTRLPGRPGFHSGSSFASLLVRWAVEDDDEHEEVPEGLLPWWSLHDEKQRAWWLERLRERDSARLLPVEQDTLARIDLTVSRRTGSTLSWPVDFYVDFVERSLRGRRGGPDHITHQWEPQNLQLRSGNKRCRSRRSSAHSITSLRRRLASQHLMLTTTGDMQKRRDDRDRGLRKYPGAHELALSRELQKPFLAPKTKRRRQKSKARAASVAPRQSAVRDLSTVERQCSRRGEPGNDEGPQLIADADPFFQVLLGYGGDVCTTPATSLHWHFAPHYRAYNKMTQSSQTESSSSVALGLGVSSCPASLTRTNDRPGLFDAPDSCHIQDRLYSWLAPCDQAEVEEVRALYPAVGDPEQKWQAPGRITRLFRPTRSDRMVFGRSGCSVFSRSSCKIDKSSWTPALGAQTMRMRLYHVLNSADNLAGILRDGFREDYATTMLLGRGVYFSTEMDTPLLFGDKFVAYEPPLPLALAGDAQEHVDRGGLSSAKVVVQRPAANAQDEYVVSDKSERERRNIRTYKKYLFSAMMTGVSSLGPRREGNSISGAPASPVPSNTAQPLVGKDYKRPLPTPLCPIFPAKWEKRHRKQIDMELRQHPDEDDELLFFRQRQATASLEMARHTIMEEISFESRERPYKLFDRRVWDAVALTAGTTKNVAPFAESETRTTLNAATSVVNSGSRADAMYVEGQRREQEQDAFLKLLTEEIYFGPECLCSRFLKVKERPRASSGSIPPASYLEEDKLRHDPRFGFRQDLAGGPACFGTGPSLQEMEMANLFAGEVGNNKTAKNKMNTAGGKTQNVVTTPSDNVGKNHDDEEKSAADEIFSQFYDLAVQNAQVDVDDVFLAPEADADEVDSQKTLRFGEDCEEDDQGSSAGETRPAATGTEAVAVGRGAPEQAQLHPDHRPPVVQLRLNKTPRSLLLKMLITGEEPEVLQKLPETSRLSFYSFVHIKLLQWFFDHSEAVKTAREVGAYQVHIKTKRTEVLTTTDAPAGKATDWSLKDGTEHYVVADYTRVNGFLSDPRIVELEFQQ